MVFMRMTPKFICPLASIQTHTHANTGVPPPPAPAMSTYTSSPMQKKKYKKVAPTVNWPTLSHLFMSFGNQLPVQGTQKEEN